MIKKLNKFIFHKYREIILNHLLINEDFDKFVSWEEEEGLNNSNDSEDQADVSIIDDNNDNYDNYDNDNNDDNDANDLKKSKSILIINLMKK